ncbi:DNA mismatch repair protein Msh2-like [Clavelina lepadiformis]|uniref:DNA mismatch repair protein Msh2-like n=1 Tax=Clavelina lepadiformis TaxID=159417 RepID=UPI0040437DD8
MANLQAKRKWCIENEGAFLQFYKSMALKAETTFQVFEHGEFYTTHGKNAVMAADHVFKTQSVIKVISNGEMKLPTVFLSNLNFESMARDLLLVRHYRLEIYKQKSKSVWTVSYKASPGNLMEVEDLLFNNVDLMSTSSAVMAIRYRLEASQVFVGVGFVDTNLCEMKYAEFSDNDHFANLESTILQLGPKECVVGKLESTNEAKKLSEIIKRSGVLMTERPKSEFSTKNLDQDLSRLLKKKKSKVSGDADANMNWAVDHQFSTSCLCALVSYLELLNKEEKFGEFVAEKYDLSQYMKLDSAAKLALNLFPEKFAGTVLSNRPSDSLYGILNHCQTPQGQRLLARWIKQPLIDVNHLEERLDAVQAFVEGAELRQSLISEHLKKLPDFDKFSKKFHRKKANLQDCYRVYQSIKQLPFICETIEKYSECLDSNQKLLKEVFTSPIHELYNDFNKFMEMLDTTLDFDMIQKHEFMVKSDFDLELQRLRTKMDDVECQMDNTFQKAASELQLEAGKGIKLETSPFGHVFRVTCKEEKALRNNKKFTTLDTNKAGVRFTNTRLEKLNAEYQECRESYENQQDAVVTEIVAIGSGYAEPLHSLSEVVAKLDVLLSFAQAAVNAPISYVRPKLNAVGSGSNLIKLVQSRHPCVEAQDGVSFIPNNAKLEKDVHNFLIITGPNMGGKSTYIRQIGVVILMAQIGCFVPCECAEITLVDAILARVGAGDCQVQGVSTFMAEMLETAAILRSATENSLVIIDELGRGTSTYDGFGLAWSISHKIAVDTKAACLFATHFDEMTALADEVTSAVNYHVTALTGTDGDGQSNLTMLYKVQPGSCDRSFGIHVAECVGFPQRVIDAAKRKADDLEDYYVTPSFDIDGQREEKSKKKRKIKQEGENVIKAFIDEVKILMNSAKSEAEKKETLKQMKEQVLASGNPFVSGVLKRKNYAENMDV